MQVITGQAEREVVRQESEISQWILFVSQGTEQGLLHRALVEGPEWDPEGKPALS